MFIQDHRNRCASSGVLIFWSSDGAQKLHVAMHIKYSFSAVNVTSLYDFQAMIKYHKIFPSIYLHKAGEKL